MSENTMTGVIPQDIQGEARVLVVLDQPLLAQVVRLTLDHGVYVTRDARNLDEAMEVLAQWQPHLAIVDMELGARRLLEELWGGAGQRTRLPVLALTQWGDLKAKLDAFEQGVDDILTIPFSPEELLARAMVITRRTYRHQVQFRACLKLGDLELDILNRRVRIGEDDLHLSGLEQNLLYLLAANVGQIVSRSQIMHTLWGADSTVNSSAVGQLIRNLRSKLQTDRRQPRLIDTITGVGYRFTANYT